jgi:hypothetical protein
MFDEIVFDKTFYDVVTFRVKSISGSKIYVKGIGFHFNFDKNNEEQMRLIANVLIDFYDAVENDLRTNEEDDKLRDFDFLIKILNRYKGE